MTTRTFGRAVAVGAAVLTVYLLTLAPTLTWAHYGADGGDLATAVVLRRLPHPPGFPAYLTLGEMFIRLPWGDPARRLNLLSAVCAAGAVALVATVTPAPVAFSLGLAPLLWSQAVITEVYAPATFFSALMTVLTLSDGPAWGLGLAWGVGLAVHPTLVFLAPLVVVRGRRAVRPLALAAGVTLTLYGPLLLAYGRHPSPWGDVGTLGGWWEFVTGRLYRGYLFGLPMSDYPRRLWALVGLLARQFTPVGGALAALGWARLRREQRPFAVASALAVAGLALYAVGYDTADSLVYLTPALPLLAVWLGAGWEQAANAIRSRRKRGAWLLLLIPLTQAVVSWEAMDLSDDRAAMDWATQVLEAAPSRAVLLTARDGDTFALWYAHDALGLRPDVLVVDVDLGGGVEYEGRPVVTVRSP